MADHKFGDIIPNPKSEGLRKVNISELYTSKTDRLLRSSVMLPSQYNSYAVCTEFARDWFLEKFPEGYFNSIYMDGSKSFDQFRMFSKLNQQVKRKNPLLAIVPTIDMNYNRNFIDSNMELSGYLKRTRMEGTIFADKYPTRGLYLAVQFKTILMNFTYRIRVDTKAQQLDMIEFLKYKHRAGMSETQNLPLEIHVPKKIIAQMAHDSGFDLDQNFYPADAANMLRYLNSHSIVPFIYKRRNATGNGEYFIYVDNCTAHIKSEFPNADENGERQDAETTNYTIDFSIEVEMTAPFCYTYYSQQEQLYINSDEFADDESVVVLMKAVRADLPPTNEVGWDQLVKTEYVVDNKDLEDYVHINFNELFEGAEILDIINYTKYISLSPSIFMDFIVFNNGNFIDYEIDWNNNELIMKEKCTHPSFVLGIYVDMGYVNNTIIHYNGDNGLQSPDSFRTASRIGKIDTVPGDIIDPISGS